MKSKKAQKNKKSQQQTKKQTNYLIWIPVIGLIALMFGGWNYYQGYKQESALADSQKSGIYRGASMMHEVQLDQSSYQFRETKPVVDPMRYTQLRQIKAYGLAKRHRQVLDQTFCYCGCAMSIRHKSLLSCFADNHAANCGICMDEAELAGEMTEKGEPMTKIVDAIDSRFG